MMAPECLEMIEQLKQSKNDEISELVESLADEWLRKDF
jgi:hypothetical protein